MIKKLVIFTISLFPALLIYGYHKEGGDMNVVGMYLMVLFIPCLLAIIATLAVTELAQKQLQWKAFSYLSFLLLLPVLLLVPVERWRPILAVTIIVAAILNFGLDVLQHKRIRQNRT